MAPNGLPHGPGPEVDVIIPAYNAGRFLRPAIESALNQEHVAARIIVVDDGSTDDTADIARSYGSGVILISQANRGLPGARNSGIAISTAPYIALLDADDIWRPGKLARQVAVLQALPQVGLVFTDMTIFRENGEIVEDGFLLATPNYASLDRQPIGDGVYLLPESLGKAVMRGNFISPSTVVLRREAIQEVGGFDEAFRVCEDAECWLRVLTRWRAAVIEDRLILGRSWGGNLGQQDERMIRGRLQLGEKVLAHPELYPEGATDYFARERAVSFYRLGVAALHNGQAMAARRYFSTSLREQPRLATALLLCSTLLGPRGRAVLLRLKRAARLKLALRVR
jgi:glycosyltransferase involved in cell wall biosynthesis